MSTLENLPSGPQGHWYCSCCQDIVFLRKPWGRWDSKRGLQCPVCHNMSADWVGDTAPTQPAPLSQEHGKELFAAIYPKIKKL